MENGSAIRTDGAREDRHDEVKSRDYSDTTYEQAQRPAIHRRTLSSSIFARLNFLRSSTEEDRPTQQDILDAVRDQQLQHDSQSQESAMVWAQKTTKPRRRTGSLRKTAILGTGRIKAEGRERRNTLVQRRPSAAKREEVDDVAAVVPTSNDEIQPSDAVQALQRRFSYDRDAEVPTNSTGWSSPAQLLSLQTDPGRTGTESIDYASPALSSPLKSPTSQSNASTTDDDDALSFSRPLSNGHHLTPSHKPTASSSSSSYFPGSDTLSRRRSTTKPLSPLAALPMDAYEEDEHSYSETEWWGWVVLFVTWIVFVVGMGSCLEVWSWAWDVGQTPYAPPELEDDPTLPIVGYYPALIMLTAVMAWVWVIVAWVGMKYFKHATIQPDDV
ncbi:Phosphatidylinositol N-acetylglucosaminyltransferase subunit Y-like protein [Elsinoe fawcettii]|nr:Phosphatidylinositol N-acetylglucosaminyltransferase subunit Y-like protein [Elsinoe fawcettii]